jgi:hypothetical protein
MDFYILVTCTWLACTPMYGYPAHMTKAECELIAKGLDELDDVSCLRESNYLIAKKHDL